MPSSLLPENEAERINALNEYRILGTSPEQSYDDITKIAATVCSAPIALMSLVDVDRQWFKSKVGVDIQETPRDWSFCAHAIHSSDPLIVPDATMDSRFIDNPLVCGDPQIRLYAGFPLENSASLRVGTLCVIDRRPRYLTDRECDVMKALARQVVAFLELRKKSINLIESFCTHSGGNRMISTCSYCRKAQDQNGEWMHLDKYLSQRSSLKFTHGICDSCIEQYFPEVLDVWRSEDELKASEP